MLDDLRFNHEKVGVKAGSCELDELLKMDLLDKWLCHRPGTFPVVAEAAAKG